MAPRGARFVRQLPAHAREGDLRAASAWRVEASFVADHGVDAAVDKCVAVDDANAPAPDFDALTKETWSDARDLLACAASRDEVGERWLARHL